MMLSVDFAPAEAKGWRQLFNYRRDGEATTPAWCLVGTLFPCIVPQALELINDFLLPMTIDFAVYTDLQRVVKLYGSSRTRACDAMDGAASKGRLDILQRLRDTRSEGCTTRALFLAATRGRLNVVKWLFQNYKDVCQLQHVRKKTMVLAVRADQPRFTKYLRRSCHPRCLQRWTEEAAAAINVTMILACVPSNFSTSEAMQVAVATGHVEALEALLLCSLSTTDVSLALQAAILGHRLHMIRMIMHRGNPFNTRRIFCAAVTSGRVDIIDLLLPENDSASIGSAGWSTRVGAVTAGFVGNLRPNVALHTLVSRLTSPRDLFVMSMGLLAATIHGALWSWLARQVDAGIAAFTPYKRRDVDATALALILLSLALGVTAYAAHLCLSHTSERLLRSLREQVLRHLLLDLKQPWFDANRATVASLGEELTREAQTIRRGLGPEIAAVLRFLTQFVGGFVLAFMTLWDLTLAISCVAPVVVSVVAALRRTGAQPENEADVVAAEALHNMPTLLALNAQRRVRERHALRVRITEPPVSCKVQPNGQQRWASR